MQDATSTTASTTTTTAETNSDARDQSAQASTSTAGSIKNDDDGADLDETGEPNATLNKRRNALTPESADIESIRQAEVQEKMSNLILPEAAAQQQHQKPENKS